MRSALIIGLGRFGRHLATDLSNLGNEVMVIDIDENAVSKLAPVVTAAQIGDCTDAVSYTHLDVYKRQCQGTLIPKRALTLLLLFNHFVSRTILRSSCLG